MRESAGASSASPNFPCLYCLAHVNGDIIIICPSRYTVAVARTTNSVVYADVMCQSSTIKPIPADLIIPDLQLHTAIPLSNPALEKVQKRWRFLTTNEDIPVLRRLRRTL